MSSSDTTSTMLALETWMIAAAILINPLFTLTLIALSGDYYWVEGWIYCLLLLLSCWALEVYLYIHDPALLKERFKRSSSDQESADKNIIKVLRAAFIVWFIVMPLDSKRYKLSESMVASIPFFYILKWLSCLMLLISYYLLGQSFLQCTFLSPILRIQKERSHKVISNGVYGVIRHPMYSGIILSAFSTPIVLESVYGFMISVIIILVFIYRTGIEEKMLEKGLDGYKRYKEKVIYRFIPFVY
eukprot:346031_1